MRYLNHYSHSLIDTHSIKVLLTSLLKLFTILCVHMHVGIWFKKIKKLVMLFQMPKETGCDFFLFVLLLLLFKLLFLVLIK